MGGKLEKYGKFEKQPSENIMKMWVLHMTQSTSAGERGKEIFRRLQRQFISHRTRLQYVYYCF